jgi:hypothetical protein
MKPKPIFFGYEKKKIRIRTGMSFRLLGRQRWFRARSKESYDAAFGVYFDMDCLCILKK